MTKDIFAQALAAHDAIHRAAIAAASARGRTNVADGRELQRLRDRAIILLGWTGALHRSEVIAIDAADVRSEHDGLLIDLP